MHHKIKKAGNVLFTLLIVAAVCVLAVEAIKVHNNEDSLFDQIAAAVDELSMKTPPSLFLARETDNGNERKENGRTKSSGSNKAVASKETTEQINVEKEEVEEQPQSRQEPPQKEENLDVPPEKIVFYRDLAKENIRLLNAERKKRGIPELKVHDGLMEIAHIKVDDMMTYNYYGHDSPRLGYTTSLIRERIGGGEIRSENLNLFKKPTFWYKDEAFAHLFSNDLAKMAQMAHDSLMRSDGHRENMLNPELVYVGVAAAGNVIVEDGEEYYVFKVAQVFMSEPW